MLHHSASSFADSHFPGVATAMKYILDVVCRVNCIFRVTQSYPLRSVSSFRLPSYSFSTGHVKGSEELSTAEYDKLSDETLENLADVFDGLGEKYNLNEEYDVQHAQGVLKVNFGSSLGTYIINRQAPNKQLWLSSPRSGPKRYDFIRARQEWVYKHDGTALHTLLEEEVSDIVQSHVTFPKR
ncbi:hypothetical protein EG68_11582 [Paragonimus skrjabini miyazakii]|uniref:ferroxidase n=1 Tax=Paragonimus skrjabini miyazakii TaxID=59628 RepID=A0A8S9YEQ6_9TREM|nr:hypothetical protein EG68_11582 [Paragonimus skrjabini miyazakii]